MRFCWLAVSNSLRSKPGTAAVAVPVTVFDFGENDMSVSDRVLAVANKTRHEQLCREIAKDLPTFIRIGSRLKELQQLEVYKETHKTFEGFVLAEFGLTRARAYQLIGASDTTESLSKILDKTEVPRIESQLREISKAPVEQQAVVVRRAAEKAAEENRKPTAKDYKQVVGELLIDGPVKDDKKPSPPKGKQLTPQEQAKANRKLVADYIAKAVNAIDDYHAVKPHQNRRAEVVKLLQQAGEKLW